MMKKMIFACAALSLLAACQSSPKKTESQNTENAFVVLNDNDVTQKKDVKLSELAEDFRIIRMDNRDEALFQFGGAYFSDNYICIKHRRAQAPLKLFDKTGKFLCDVGSVGQGPGEYTSIYDALIDEKNGNIYVAPFAWNPRILKYGFDGKFKGEITLKGNINKGKLYLQPDGTLSMVHLCFQDLDGTFTGANIQPNDTSRTQYVFNKSVASNFRDAGGMNVGFNNEIWSYRNTDTFSFQTTFNDTVYHYDVANNQMTPRFLYAMNPEVRKTGWFIVNELPHHFAIIVVAGEKSRKVLMDKKTGEAYEATFINDFMGNMGAGINFEDGYYFSCAEPMELQEWIEETLASGDCPKDEVEKMTKLKDSLHENDNNILMIAKLKK